MVPFVRIKLDLSLRLGCGIILSFSVHSFIKPPISFLLTTTFFEIWWKVREAVVQTLQYHIAHNQIVADR